MAKDQDQEKTTVTNVAVTLGKGRFKALQAGAKAYQSGYDKPAKDIRSLHFKIGIALNLIYVDLKEAGVKRDEISKIVDDYFPDMSTDNRSKYRKFADHIETINTYIVSKNQGLYSLQKIIKKLNEYLANIKQSQNEANNFFNLDFTQFVEQPDQEGFTRDEKGKVIPISKKEVEIAEQKTKKGILPPSTVRTAKEFKDLTDKYFNHAEMLFNSDKFTSDDDFKVLQYIHERMKSFTELTREVVEIEVKKVA